MRFETTALLRYNGRLAGMRGKLWEIPGRTRYSQFDVAYDTLLLLREDFGLEMSETTFVPSLDLFPKGDLLVPEDGSYFEELFYGVFAKLGGYDRLVKTDADLKKMYNQFNRAYFNDRLPKLVAVEWSTRMKGKAGVCYYNRDRGELEYKFVIRLSVAYHNQYPDQVANTLLHEMIHVRHPGNHHGQLFMNTMHSLNTSFGLGITRHCDTFMKNYLYVCVKCGAEYHRVRKLNTSARRYFCGDKRCKGDIVLVADNTDLDEDALVYTDMANW